MKNNNNLEDNSANEVIINLKDLAEENKHHPAHDPGTIVIYVYKIDNDDHRTRDRHISYAQLFEACGKNPNEFNMYLVRKEHGHRTEIEVTPHETIDLTVYGVEQFITRKKKVLYKFSIDKAHFTTYEESLTVRQLLTEYAKVDPSKKTLALKTGNGFHEYKDLDEAVPMKDCPHFTVFDNDSTTVS